MFSKQLRRRLLLAFASAAGLAVLLSQPALAGVRLGGGGVRLSRPGSSMNFSRPSGGFGNRFNNGFNNRCPPRWCMNGWGCSTINCAPWGGFPWWFYSRNSTFNGPPLIEVVRRIDPGILGLPITDPPPPPDEGLVALALNDYPRAVIVYAQRFSDKPTASDQRLLAIALIGARRFEDAAANMQTAFTTEPALSEQPLNGPMLVNGEMEMRRLVNAMVAFSQRSQTPEAWFTVSVLMQAEGRVTWARRMYERAENLREKRGNSPAVAPMPERPSGQ